IVAPRDAWMSASATLTMLMSITSSRAPTATATATAHLLTGLAEAGASDAGTAEIATRVPSLLPRVDRQIDAPARPERHARGRIRDVNADGNALHDLGEVAARVVRREQREARSGGARHALHVALELHAGVGVDRELDGLARAHVPDLRLFEVRRDP